MRARHGSTASMTSRVPDAVYCSDLTDDMIRPPPNFDALVLPTATLPYAGVQAVPLPAPPGAAALTTQRVRGATRGNSYDNLSNQGPSLPSLWTDRPTFAAANDGNLPAVAPSAFRTVNIAELPETTPTRRQRWRNLTRPLHSCWKECSVEPNRAATLYWAPPRSTEPAPFA